MFSKLFGIKTLPNLPVAPPPGFAEYYVNHIKPQAEIFEQKRLKYLKIFYAMLFVSLLLLLIVNHQSRFFHQLFSDTYTAYSIVLFIILVILAQPILLYKKSIKREVFPIVFKFFGDNLSYVPDPTFSARELEAFGIIPRFNDEDAQDEIKTSYKQITIHMMQDRLITGYGKHRRVQFSGVFINLSMNKKFNCQTIVQSRSIVNLMQNLDSILGFSTDLQEVQLEDPRFENVFKVVSDNQVQARYLLTPSFMDNLMKLNELFGNKSIDASFFEESLLLKISSDQEWFSADSLFKTCNFAHDAKMILQKMQIIFDIIDTLKLDQNTGL